MKPLQYNIQIEAGKKLAHFTCPTSKIEVSKKYKEKRKFNVNKEMEEY